MKITKSSDLKKQYFNCVLLGHAGAGKTSLARTLPDIKKTLFINIARWEDGYSVLSDLDMDVINIENFEELSNLPKMLSSKEFDKYDFIFFDSISAASKVSILHFEEETKKSQNKFLMYELHADFLTNLLLEMKSLKKHLFITALPDMKKGRDGSDIMSFYIDGNAFLKTLEACVDAILVVGISSDGQRKLLTQNNGVWVAKLRHNATVKVDKSINADLGSLLKLLGYVGGENVKQD